MSRADDARRQRDADARDRRAHERPNVPPEPAGAPDTWEGHCSGNRTMAHGWPTMKTPELWRCGSCGRWLTPPARTRVCVHKLRDDGVCGKCGAVTA